MATLISPNNASTVMQSRLPKIYSPYDIADAATTTDLWLMRPETTFSSVVAGGIQQVNNLADPARYVAASASGRRPVFVLDDVLGQYVADYNADRQRELVCTGTADYTAAFTMLVVSKQAAGARTSSMTMGAYGSNPASAWIGRNSAGSMTSVFGTGGSIVIANDGLWKATWLSHDPVTDTIGLRIGTDDWVYDTYTTASTATALRFGQTATQGFEGRIAMGAFFNVNFSDAANVTAFSAARSMVDRLFGGKVSV